MFDFLRLSLALTFLIWLVDSSQRDCISYDSVKDLRFLSLNNFESEDSFKHIPCIR